MERGRVGSERLSFSCSGYLVSSIVLKACVGPVRKPSPNFAPLSFYFIPLPLLT